jgi:hypothetical protein
MSTEQKLQGKVALITGGNSGIGLATAKRFVAEGAYVFITGRRQTELDSAVKTIGENVTGIQGNVAKLGDLDQIYSAIRTQKGRGGSVITEAAAGSSNVKTLVYVAGLAPDTGESAADIGGRFPGSTLGPTLAPPTTLPDGGKDLYIQQDKFPLQFAADVPKPEAKLMAATQRPVTASALHEAAKQAAWKRSPPGSFSDRWARTSRRRHEFMAQRANAKATVDVEGASHVVMISHPDAVTALIEKAAEAIGR